MSQGDVSEFPGCGNALRPERLPDAGLSEIGTMDMEVYPPCPVIVKQMVIQIPRVGAEREDVGFHVEEVFSHTTPRETLVGRGVRPARIYKGQLAPYNPPSLLRVRLAGSPNFRGVTLDVAHFLKNKSSAWPFRERSSYIKSYDADRLSPKCAGGQLCVCGCP